MSKGKSLTFDSRKNKKSKKIRIEDSILVILPKNLQTRRKDSHSVLLSVTGIVLSPFHKKRVNCEKMGSVCIKGTSLEPAFQKSETKHGSSKISPSPVNILDSPTREPNMSASFCKSGITIDPVLEFTENKIIINKQMDYLDSLPGMLEEAPVLRKTISNTLDENINSDSIKDTVEVTNKVVNYANDNIGITNNDIDEVFLPAMRSTTKQRSLPDLRPCDSQLKRSNRFSQGDALKMNIGCANLMDTKNRFVEKRSRTESKKHASVTENSVIVEKRRKRLPTVENGIHVLDSGQVNCYHILEEIGRGSFGSVCKCQSQKDNCYYAMKIISKKRLMRKNRQLTHKPGSKSNPLESLYREVAILKKMDHPNIVKLIEVIDDIQVDNFYMIFELMTGGVVIDIPTDDVIPEERTRSLFRELLLGIEYLHYSKIIHRDIKPSNLLLDDSDHIKIADFGVSNMFEGEDDLLNKYAGSPAFQAPEVLDYDSRDKYSGKAVDVWAMGVTLYCFLYGKCPFFSNNFGELSNMIKNNLVSFPDSPILNPQVQDLISRMLSKQAKDRITVIEIKEHPWVTEGGTSILPSTEEHCSVIEVTEEEVRNSIKIISKLSSLVLAKSILKGKSFLKCNSHSNTGQ